MKNVHILFKSDELQIHNPLLGQIMGRARINLEKITIKMECRYELVRDAVKVREVIGLTLDVPEEHISIDIESGMTGPILATACNVLKARFHQETVAAMDEELLKFAGPMLPVIIETLLQQDAVTGARFVQNVFGKDNQGETVVKLRLDDKVDELLPKQVELSIPKLMMLGIMYTLSSATQRAETLYELL